MNHDIALMIVKAYISIQFHSKNYHNTLEVEDDYNIPHWMNHDIALMIVEAYLSISVSQ